MISFIIPAHNEQACLPATLAAIHESARAVGQPYEIIVVDDACTDGTPEIARQNGADVVRVNHRQIAATRNAGARAARGERLFFVDADTVINPGVVAAALRAMENGAVGGGAPARVDAGVVPLYVRLISGLAIPISKLAGFTGGAFMFCTHNAFQTTGGFNERLYWSEEGAFALALKREGRFVVLWQSVLTSGRRFRKISGLQLLAGGFRLIRSPVRFFTQRSYVAEVWYDSNRKDDDKMPDSLAIRVSNGVALLILLVLLTGPLWNFVPWSLTPLDSIPGIIRFGIRALLSHAGLLFWPCALALFVNLLRQKRWTGLVHTVCLIALCVWQGWVCARNTVWIWARLFQWLVG